MLRVLKEPASEGPYRIGIEFTDNNSELVKTYLDIYFKPEPCLISNL
jgi:hypothetical protein